MIVLPLTVAIVMALVADLDTPRTDGIHTGQQSMDVYRSNSILPPSSSGGAPLWVIWNGTRLT